MGFQGFAKPVKDGKKGGITFGKLNDKTLKTFSTSAVDYDLATIPSSSPSLKNQASSVLAWVQANYPSKTWGSFYCYLRRKWFLISQDAPSATVLEYSMDSKTITYKGTIDCGTSGSLAMSSYNIAYLKGSIYIAKKVSNLDKVLVKISLDNLAVLQTHSASWTTYQDGGFIKLLASHNELYVSIDNNSGNVGTWSITDNGIATGFTVNGKVFQYSFQMTTNGLDKHSAGFYPMARNDGTLCYCDNSGYWGRWSGSGVGNSYGCIVKVLNNTVLFFGDGATKMQERDASANVIKSNTTARTNVNGGNTQSTLKENIGGGLYKYHNINRSSHLVFDDSANLLSDTLWSSIPILEEQPSAPQNTGALVPSANPDTTITDIGIGFQQFATSGTENLKTAMMSIVYSTLVGYKPKTDLGAVLMLNVSQNTIVRMSDESNITNFKDCVSGDRLVLTKGTVIHASDLIKLEKYIEIN